MLLGQLGKVAIERPWICQLGFDRPQSLLRLGDLSLGLAEIGGKPSAHRGVLLLCRTSNPGSADFQDLACRFDGGEMPLYQVVAQQAQAWSAEGCLGLVVGATYPREVAAVRAIAPALPFLLPGVGTQGGDLEAAVRAGVDGSREQAIVSVSRQVMYASAERNWQQAARRAAILFRDRIEAARGAPE